MKDVHNPLQFFVVQLMNLCKDQVDYLVPVFLFFFKEPIEGCIKPKYPPAINLEASGKNENRV